MAHIEFLHRMSGFKRQGVHAVTQREMKLCDSAMDIRFVHEQCVDGVPSFYYCCNLRPHLDTHIPWKYDCIYPYFKRQFVN